MQCVPGRDGRDKLGHDIIRRRGESAGSDRSLPQNGYLLFFTTEPEERLFCLQLLDLTHEVLGLDIHYSSSGD